MFNPRNIQEIVDLHNRDLVKLVGHRRSQGARRLASSSLRRWRTDRDARSR